MRPPLIHFTTAATDRHHPFGLCRARRFAASGLDLPLTAGEEGFDLEVVAVVPLSPSQEVGRSPVDVAQALAPVLGDMSGPVPREMPRAGARLPPGAAIRGPVEGGSTSGSPGRRPILARRGESLGCGVWRWDGLVGVPLQLPYSGSLQRRKC